MNKCTDFFKYFFLYRVMWLVSPLPFKKKWQYLYYCVLKLPFQFSNGSNGMELKYFLWWICHYVCDSVSFRPLWLDKNATGWTIAQTYKLGLCGQASLKLFYLLHVAAVCCRKRLGACPYQLPVLSWRKEMVRSFHCYRVQMIMSAKHLP